MLELLLFSKVVTGLNWNTLDQYQCFHGFPKYLSVLHLIAFTIQVRRRKQLLQTIWFFKLAVQLATQLFNLPIKYLKLLKTIHIHWVFLSTFISFWYSRSYNIASNTGTICYHRKIKNWMKKLTMKQETI